MNQQVSEEILTYNERLAVPTCVRCARDPRRVGSCHVPLLQKCDHCNRSRHDCVPVPKQFYPMVNVLLETASQIADEQLPMEEHLARYCKRFDRIATQQLTAEGKKGRSGKTKSKADDNSPAALALLEQRVATDALRDIANQLRWINEDPLIAPRNGQFPRDWVLSNTPQSTGGQRVMREDPAAGMRGVADDEANDYQVPVVEDDVDMDG
ncbi:hypothetical protein E6O75_ATG06559 [Venturia nashicola]|uniref:Uncharacterized protein n=1 Tax=Venturia nashicola TaxID=86259 RepID=A0A4Z1NY67_9PEZI|nr:hypothetical protein E6O75_ATG06559 [Venturia nashicola]